VKISSVLGGLSLKNLVRPKAEVKGPAFLVELSDLKVDMTVNVAFKELVRTPSLRGKLELF